MDVLSPQVHKDVSKIGQADAEMGVVLPTSGIVGFQSGLADYFDRKSETRSVHVVADGSMVF